MNTGALRELATLDVPTADGGIVPLTPATWFCAVRDEGQGTVLLTGRAHPEISTATRVHLRDRLYHVDSVRTRERDAALELACHEVFD